jgi:hypothetical protein
MTVARARVLERDAAVSSRSRETLPLSPERKCGVAGACSLVASD